MEFVRIWDLKDLQGFWERIHDRICEDLHFGRGFRMKTLGEDSQDFGRGFGRICEDLQDFGRGFVKLWERIHEDLWGFMQDFGFRIHKTLGEDS